MSLLSFSTFIFHIVGSNVFLTLNQTQFFSEAYLSIKFLCQVRFSIGQKLGYIALFRSQIKFRLGLVQVRRRDIHIQPPLRKVGLNIKLVKFSVVRTVSCIFMGMNHEDLDILHGVASQNLTSKPFLMVAVVKMPGIQSGILNFK